MAIGTRDDLWAVFELMYGPPAWDCERLGHRAQYGHTTCRECGEPIPDPLSEREADE